MWQGAEIVLAAVHAGEEYSSRPSPQQLQVNRALADSGQFDLVYGHHTHSVLPVEKHGDTWIVHGLGNSLSEHATRVPVNNEGLTVRATFVRADGRWTARPPVWVPHVLTVAWEPAERPLDDRGYGARLRHRSDLEVAADFVEHVRHTPAGADECALLGEAFDAVRIAAAADEVA